MIADSRDRFEVYTVDAEGPLENGTCGSLSAVRVYLDCLSDDAKQAGTEPPIVAVYDAKKDGWLIPPPEMQS